MGRKICTLTETCFSLAQLWSDLPHLLKLLCQSSSIISGSCQTITTQMNGQRTPGGSYGSVTLPHMVLPLCSGHYRTLVELSLRSTVGFGNGVPRMLMVIASSAKMEMK